jgi:hypothetical protein
MAMILMSYICNGDVEISMSTNFSVNMQTTDLIGLKVREPLIVLIRCFSHVTN